MDAKIDYLSWTVMSDPRGAGEGAPMQLAALQIVADSNPAFFLWAEETSGWQGGGARGHYSTSMFNARHYASIRYGGSANHVLIEMPGTACQSARDLDHLDAIVEQAAPRLTRLDIAVDINGGIHPRTFVLAGYNERFKAYAEIVSAEGATEYVGSMKSDRYARVYKYNEPHPRAGLMRVEFVLRRDYAKNAAAELARRGLKELVALLGNTWGWRSEAWKPEATTDGKLRSSRADRHEPGRVRWLHQVVMPALVKADAEGLIDLDDFVRRALELRRAH